MEYDIKLNDVNSTYYKKVYPNGCKLLVESLPWSFTSSIGVWIQVGSKNELVHEKGLSHLLEHIIFGGTTNKSSSDITEHIESAGGKINAITERELTCFSAKVLNEDVVDGLNLLYDMIANPVFDKDYIEKEKNIINQEISESEDDYNVLVHDLFMEHVLPNNIGQPIYGERSVVDGATVEDLRHFYAKHYTPENMIISVAGNCNAEEIIKVLGKTFGSLEGSTRETVEFERPAYEKNRVQKNYEIDHTYFCLGVQGLKQKDDDRVAMYAISSILGEGMSSRFYKEIREEYGLAYTIYTYYTLYAEAGTFAIAGICSNEDLEQITELILKQIKNLINVTVPQQELDRAKAKLKGNFYINLESVENRMIRLAKLEDWHGRHFTIGDELEMLNAVSATDVQRVSKKLFHDKPWVEAMVMNH